MGRILRAGEAARSLPGPADLLAAARAEAGAVLEAARQEAERIRSGAAAAGREEGLRSLAAERAEIEAERAAILDRAEEEIVRLALAVAGKVLSLATRDGRAAQESARRALARARGRKELSARVHPADAEVLRAEVPALLAAAPAGARLDVREDPTVGRGGVLLETEAGTVDARVEAQLESLGRALQEQP